MAYDSFWQAYQAMHPDSPYTPAAQTWTPANKQALADAYAYGYTNPVNPEASNAGNPTWTPPAADNAALPHPIQPVTFNPFADLGYAGTAGIYGYTAKDDAGNDVYHPGTMAIHAQANRDYNVGSGEQNFGIYSSGEKAGQVIQDPAYQNYNPFSQAAELQRSYDNTKRGTINNYAASGQLYSGALINKQTDDTHNYDVSSDRLKRAATDYYHGQDYNVTQTEDQGLGVTAGAYGTAFQNFLNQQKGY